MLARFVSLLTAVVYIISTRVFADAPWEKATGSDGHQAVGPSIIFGMIGFHFDKITDVERLGTAFSSTMDNARYFHEPRLDFLIQYLVPYGRMGADRIASLRRNPMSAHAAHCNQCGANRDNLV